MTKSWPFFFIFPPEAQQAAKNHGTTPRRAIVIYRHSFVLQFFIHSFIHSDILYSFILSFSCTISLPVERLFFAACLLDTALAALGQRFFWSNLTTYLLFFCILLFEAPNTPESSGSFLTLHRVQSVAYRVSQAQTIHR